MSITVPPTAPDSRPPPHELAAWATDRALRSFPYFLHWVKTVDEAEPDPRARVKPLPADFDYIRHVAQTLQDQPLLWVPKSRRMIMTWLHAAELVWRMLQPRTHVFLQTKKEADADWLVKERAWFIYQYLPEWLKYVALAGKTAASYKYCKLELSNGSKCWGVPQGADQFRGFTPSAVFVDEAAYQDEFDNTHTAILPLSEKGCVLRFVSSASPSYFSEIVTGGVNGQVLQPMPGIREWWLNEGGYVMRVHYTADPFKDPAREGKEWLARESIKYPGGVKGSKWLQEMEIDFAAYSGQLVYDAWTPDKHLVEPFGLDDHPGPYWRAMDYGVRNPTVCLWFTELDGAYYLVREFYQVGLEIESLKRALYAMSPGHERYASTWLDPRSDRHEQVGEASAFFNLNRDPYSIGAIKANSSAAGIDIIRQWLIDDRLKVFNNCANFIREIEGYRYEDWTNAVGDKHNLKEKPLKRDDHSMDALKYFANGVLYREGDKPVRSMPAPIRIRSRRDELMYPRRGRWLGKGGVIRYA